MYIVQILNWSFETFVGGKKYRVVFIPFTDLKYLWIYWFSIIKSGCTMFWRQWHCSCEWESWPQVWYWCYQFGARFLRSGPGQLTNYHSTPFYCLFIILNVLVAHLTFYDICHDLLICLDDIVLFSFLVLLGFWTLSVHEHLVWNYMTNLTDTLRYSFFKQCRLTKELIS